jgi:hypothetical protein
MKISNRNYPILEKLYKGSLGKIPINVSDELFFNKLGTDFNLVWKYYRKYFIQDINIVSKSFADASTKAFHKLFDLWNDCVVNDISDFIVNGTYIIDNAVYMIHYETKQGSESQSIALYVFDRYGMPRYLYIHNENGINGWISQQENIDSKEKDKIENILLNRLAQVIVLSMFKSYAEVETKTLFAKTKKKESYNKYVNDTDLNLTFIDSKWFTSIVKSEGFSVRGHFRLQPKKKNGEWTKELIWVNEFNKLGYTAPARKLSSTSPPSYTPHSITPHIVA